MEKIKLTNYTIYFNEYNKDWYMSDEWDNEHFLDYQLKKIFNNLSVKIRNIIKTLEKFKTKHNVNFEYKDFIKMINNCEVEKIEEKTDELEEKFYNEYHLYTDYRDNIWNDFYNITDEIEELRKLGEDFQKIENKEVRKIFEREIEEFNRDINFLGENIKNPVYMILRKCFNI